MLFWVAEKRSAFFFLFVEEKKRHTQTHGGLHYQEMCSLTSLVYSEEEEEDGKKDDNTHSCHSKEKHGKKRGILARLFSHSTSSNGCVLLERRRDLASSYISTAARLPLGGVLL